ncbi:MAG: HD family phosphohydrolase [Kiritimatiellales bacterium]
MKRKLFKQTTERVAATKDLTAHRAKRKLPVFNLLVGILGWLLVITVFYSGRLMRPQQLALGQQAPETVVTAVDFKAETLAATQLKKREAADQILPVFAVETTGIDRARQALTKVVPRLKSLRTTTSPEQNVLLKTSITDLLDAFAVSLTTDELLRIVPPEEPDLQTVILSAITVPIQTGIISETDLKNRFNGLAIHDQITVREPKTETIRDLSSFQVQSEALQNAVAAISRQLPHDNRDDAVIRKLILPWMHPNVVYDAAETAARRAQAVDMIEPVMDSVEAGTILVRAGDTVSEQTLRWLTAHEKRLSELETPAERIQRLGGSGVLLLIGLCLTAAIAGVIRPVTLRCRRDVLLLFTITLLPLLIGKALLHLAVNLSLLPPALLDFMMPLALAPILASVLLGGSAGLIAGFWTSFALAVLPGGNFNILVTGLMVTLTAVYTTRDVKRRTSLFRAGLWAGAVKIFFALNLAVINQPAWTVLLPQIGTALLSGIVSALLAILLIPLFEHLFKVTTDITLLELSDLSHPLLQSLAINAPGTYHHSLMMASLAQNAADSIGANGLMLRVCAYFHDIGKLVKPGFFSENIQFTENPHDDLSPSMSTLVIVSHIKEGVTLAKKYKLPQVIINGIEQHQGTSLVSVFYHRAKAQQQKENGSSAQPINDEDFRYEGPKPQNREMAILMLADGCEAASRSLEKPNPVRIGNLIGEIFDSRLRDGQLDECNLTLAELSRIKQSFIFTLTNMLHGRVAYPKEENEKESKKDEAPKPDSHPAQAQ